MDVKAETVTLSVSDGTSMRAYVARPFGEAPAKGLIVCQEAFGVNAHIRDVTERFAREGYFAIAPEFFHRTGEHVEVPYDDFQSATTHLQALSDSGLEADLRAAHACLCANGTGANFPISMIGFCLGGKIAFLGTLTIPIQCAISFYGGGIAPSQRGPGLLGRVKDVRAPMLLIWGGKDKHIGPDQSRAVADALREASKSFVSVEFSDADHGFFNDAKPSYHAPSAAEAWQLVLAFLAANASQREQARSSRAKAARSR